MKDQVRHALNEGRILVLGTQVLLGFQFRGVLEPRFEHLPAGAQWAKVVGLALLVVAFGVLIAPAAYHRIVARGEATARLHRFTTVATAFALLPVAFAFGIDGFEAAEGLIGARTALISGIALLVVALACWYAVPLALRRNRPREDHGMKDAEPTPLKDKIEHVLTEIRMVLPGAQALLGFGLAATLMDSFGHLPSSSQAIHVGGIFCVALATIMLMTPAARHRLVERGADTEAFHRFASGMLLAAMVPLACGIAAEVLVVVRRVYPSLAVATGAAAASLVFFFGFWFGLTAWLRRRQPVAEPAAAEQRKAA